MDQNNIDRRLFIIFAVVALFAIGLFVYKVFAGLILTLSLILFGSLAVLWKERHIKLAALAALIILSLINIGINGLKFGIDFNGGVRIPILLEKSVDNEVMADLITTIKKRVSFLGLGESKVRAVGDNVIHVELPKASDQEVSEIERILSQQGVFLGVANGSIALRGEDVYRESIVPTSSPQQDWSVSFRLTNSGAEKFAAAVKGKANKPLYMFIDRPSDAVIFLSMEDLRKKAPADAIDNEIMKAVEDVLFLEGDKIDLYLIDNLVNTTLQPKTNQTKALISENAGTSLKNQLKDKGFVLRELSDDEISPDIQGLTSSLAVDRWEAIGLLSSPNLAEGVTQGTPNYQGYSIGGSFDRSLPSQTRARLARDEIRRVESILKGGALPVQISLGSKTDIPATLGNESLKVSLIGITVALIAISLLIAFRYRSPRIVMPIIAISLSELLILLSILGSFTIDLPAIAGIIAAIGVSVDAQIVITDEMLKRTKDTIEEGIEQAFDIIKTNVVVAIVAMLPLLFSGIVEVITFAISTIIGSLLGFLISRPGYAVIAKSILVKEEK